MTDDSRPTDRRDLVALSEFCMLMQRHPDFPPLRINDLRAWLYRRIVSGLLPAVRIDDRYFMRPADVGAVVEMIATPAVRVRAAVPHFPSSMAAAAQA